MSLRTIIICAMFAYCTALPVDNPVRIDLPVYDQPQPSSDAFAQPLEPENTPGEDRSDKSLVGSLIYNKLHTATDVLGKRLSSTYAEVGSHHVAGGLFSPPVTTLEGALLETEDLLSKKQSIKDNLHHIVSGFLQPKPIVDTIKEEEKYGNHGDKFYAVGKHLVGRAEGVSNLVNTVLEVPGNIFKKITRVATEKLNNLGGKLIGL